MSKINFKEAIEKAGKLEEELRSGQYGDFSFQDYDSLIYTSKDADVRKMALEIEGHRKGWEAYQMTLKANAFLFAACVNGIVFRSPELKEKVEGEERFWISNFFVDYEAILKDPTKAINIGQSIAQVVEEKYPLRIVKECGFVNSDFGEVHIWFMLH